MSEHQTRGLAPLKASLPALQRPQTQAELQWANYVLMRATGLLKSCRLKSDADDPEHFLAGIVSALGRYPQEVVDAVTDPGAGRFKFIPTPYEIREACEIAMGPVRAREARARQEQQAARLREEMEQAQVEAGPRSARMSYDELKAKYGDNYGLKPGGLEKFDEREQKRRDGLRRANRAAFEAECVAAGINPDTTTISPSLHRMIAGERGMTTIEAIELAEAHGD